MDDEHPRDRAGHQPFRVLEQWVRDGRIRLSGAGPVERADEAVLADPISDPEPEPASDAELFAEAMRDVEPMDWNSVPVPGPPPIDLNASDGEDAVLRALADFCRTGQVGPEHTREYVEHVAAPVGRLYLPGLRNGRFSVQAHLDLHGLTLGAARRIVDLFVRESAAAGHSCVRIVHGRGRHSEDGLGLLKKNVERWLRSRRLARYIVAFTSARVVDGGGGAVYVLLRQR